MHAQRFTVTIVTDGSGDGTGYTDPVNGLLDRIVYDKAGSGGYDNGVDFVVTMDESGEILWDEDNVNASAARAVRQATHSTAGAAALYAAGGEAVRDRIAVTGRIKVVVAAGGAAKTGTFHVYTV